MFIPSHLKYISKSLFNNNQKVITLLNPLYNSPRDMIIIRAPVANSKYLVYALCVYYDAISSQGGRTTKLAVDAKITGARYSAGPFYSITVMICNHVFGWDASISNVGLDCTWRWIIHSQSFRVG